MGSSKSKNNKSENYKVKRYSIIKDYIIKDEIVAKSLSGNILVCSPKKRKDQKFVLKILYYKNGVTKLTSEFYNIHIFNIHLKDLDQKLEAQTEYNNQWKASMKGESKYVPNIIDIFKADIEGHKAYLVVMEL